MDTFQFFAIVGVGRSGTTLLMSMLSAHPDMTMPPEFHFVNQYILTRPGATLPEMTERLTADARFARLGLTIKEAVQPFTDQNESFSTVKLYRAILSLYAVKQGVHIIGDKSPKNIECLPILRRVFPDAKIIHLIRDPRDVYLSRKQAAWSASRSDTLQFLAYRAQYELGQRLGPQLFGDNYLEIYYENLLSQPQTELERVCRLLDVPFDERMLNFSGAAKELVFADEIAWKKEALGPLLTQNMNKWRRELTPEKVRQIEAACSPTFNDGFYTPSQQRNTMGTALTHVSINAYMFFLTKIYQQAVLFKNWKALRAIGGKCL